MPAADARGIRDHRHQITGATSLAIPVRIGERDADPHVRTQRRWHRREREIELVVVHPVAAALAADVCRSRAVEHSGCCSDATDSGDRSHRIDRRRRAVRGRRRVRRGRRRREGDRERAALLRDHAIPDHVGDLVLVGGVLRQRAEVHAPGCTLRDAQRRIGRATLHAVFESRRDGRAGGRRPLHVEPVYIGCRNRLIERGERVFGNRAAAGARGDDAGGIHRAGLLGDQHSALPMLDFVVVGRRGGEQRLDIDFKPATEARGADRRERRIAGALVAEYRGHARIDGCRPHELRRTDGAPGLPDGLDRGSVGIDFQHGDAGKRGHAAAREILGPGAPGVVDTRVVTAQDVRRVRLGGPHAIARLHVDVGDAQLEARGAADRRPTHVDHVVVDPRAILRARAGRHPVLRIPRIERHRLRAALRDAERGDVIRRVRHIARDRRPS